MGLGASNAMVSMQRGHVEAYRASRGFGFIKPDGNFGDLFVRAEDVEDDHVDLVPGEPVEYQLQVGTGGQLRAVAVRRLDPMQPRPPQQR